MPQSALSLSLGLVLLIAIVVAGLVVTLSGNRSAPLLGGNVESVPGGTGWKPILSALLFGLGWGLAGYFPLAALVSAGLFSPGAAIFLASVLGGMIVHDVLAGDVGRTGGGRGSRG
jgi:uncharacterized membrane protein YedE/YeeE